MGGRSTRRERATFLDLPCRKPSQGERNRNPMNVAKKGRDSPLPTAVESCQHLDGHQVVKERLPTCSGATCLTAGSLPLTLAAGLVAFLAQVTN